MNSAEFGNGDIICLYADGVNEATNADNEFFGNDRLVSACQDVYKRQVDRWLPIVAASQSVKGKPEEREFLLKWASVCEYQ